MNAAAARRIAERLRALPPSPLVPSSVRDAALDREIEALGGDGDPEGAARSALHLWNDSLTNAHTLAQEIHDATGSYLHGLMHRREPDYENSKYWFRRVDRHPLFPDVRAAALEVLRERPDLRAGLEVQPAWDPFHMVDWCREAASKPELEAVLRRIQAREIALLADFCLSRLA